MTTIHLTVPAEHRYLNTASAVINEFLIRTPGFFDDGIVVYSLQLAVQEVCTNIVDHSYADSEGRIAINFTVESKPLRMEVEISDESEFSFDPTTIPEPDIDELKLNGRGLMLIRQLMDKVSYIPSNGATCYIAERGAPWQSVPCVASTQPGNRWHLLKYL